MRDLIFKGIIVIAILMIFVVCLSGVSADESGNEVSVMTLSQDGITIDYPSNWQSSRSTSNYSIMAVSKIDSVDSFGVAQVAINVEKKPIDLGVDFYTFVNNTYKSMDRDSSFELISSGGFVINNHDAVEYIYTSVDDSGSQREHKAIWFEKNGQAYVLLYSAPLDQFESNLYVFDYMLSNIKIS